ncbi:hypothetical protein HMPREF0262_03399 [Clostridium sp. ATCC 29733]|nr:hypothetical protein HMPREF0262_03399 [Clostridium sp. ATCC 29733]
MPIEIPPLMPGRQAVISNALYLQFHYSVYHTLLQAKNKKRAILFDYPSSCGVYGSK